MTTMRIEPAIGVRGWATALFVLALVVVSFASLGIDLRALVAPQAAVLAREFVAGFAPPDTSATFVRRVAIAGGETIAMSAIGTLVATILGLALALPASARRSPIAKSATRVVLAVLRAIPELVWGALFVIAAGLGPLAGTMALALHTTGVLGRLFAETIENLPPGPADALRASGVGPVGVFCYATLPQALAQFASYALYRWENNIRAATILGVVGAGGLGQMLVFELSLFRMREVATIVLALVVLVALVDAISVALRGKLVR
jgi:phosphonate transport system permease protein